MSIHSESHERQAASGPPDAAAGALSAEELRGAPRFALLLRVAKLVVDDCERFCVIRDASATGLKVRLFAPVPKAAKLEIELANGDRHRVECMWNADDHAGLRFLVPIELDRLLDEARGTGQRRHVRLRVAFDGVLHSGGKVVPVTFHDISQQGGSLISDKWLLLNELVKIETSVLPPVYAKVRWRDHPRYGVIFEQTFKLEDLAQRCSGLPASIEARPDYKSGKV